MLTISQLATYTGVTVRAVRHYHQVGLMPEPERDRSGYRVYGADAVVRLIRIHALVQAGVPLARVDELLDADQAEFVAGVREIDRELRDRIHGLLETRTRLARLAAGESLALPQSVVSYLDRLRALGVEERYMELERDAWIMVAAQLPAEIDEVMRKKHEELDDPDVRAFYVLISGAFDWSEDDPRIVDVADVLERMMIKAVRRGAESPKGLDDPVVELLDGVTANSAPAARRLLEILEERGWRGWTRLERIPADRVALDG